MAEVAIKEHTRRGKGGKTVHVRGYTRRVGHKGVHSPKRERKKDEGKEFEEKVNEKKQEQKPQMSPEELKKKLKERKDWEESARRAEEERKSLGMSKEKYSFYKVKQQQAPKSSHTKSVHKPLSPKGSQTILDRVEDKIAEFINKYSKKKYKKYL